MQSPLTTPADALAFVLGGKARFTLRSKASGARYTYRVNASKDGRVSFASLLTGADNDTSYTYLGTVRQGVFALTAKSRMTADSTPVKALAWSLAQLRAGKLPPTLEVWHDGRCGRSFGPECVRHVH